MHLCVLGRDAKRAGLLPVTGGRMTAAAAGPVVGGGGGALRAVVQSGRGVLQVCFLVSSRRSSEPAPVRSGFVAAVA